MHVISKMVFIFLEHDNQVIVLESLFGVAITQFLLQYLGLILWPRGGHSHQLPYGGVPLYRVDFERPVSLK